MRSLAISFKLLKMLLFIEVERIHKIA